VEAELVALGASPQSDRLLPRGLACAGLDHLAQLLLQLRDLVTQPGSELELQLGRRGVHLLGELLDEVGEVL
jgi:hypothetical protein